MFSNSLRMAVIEIILNYIKINKISYKYLRGDSTSQVFNRVSCQGLHQLTAGEQRALS